MRKIVIAFDVDGTLIRNGHGTGTDIPMANWRIVELLMILASFKNVKIIIWSGQGKDYARQVAQEISVVKYVDGYASKNLVTPATKNQSPKFTPVLKPDIAIDDIQSCDLGVLNLIVREK